MLPSPTTALPKASNTVNLTTGGLAIVTLVMVTVGSRSDQTAALAAIASGFQVLLPTLVVRFRLPAASSPVPGGPEGPEGPGGPGGPAGPAAPVSPPQPLRDAAITVATATASQYGSCRLPIAVLLMKRITETRKPATVGPGRAIANRTLGT